MHSQNPRKRKLSYYSLATPASSSADTFYTCRDQSFGDTATEEWHSCLNEFEDSDLEDDVIEEVQEGSRTIPGEKGISKEQRRENKRLAIRKLLHARPDKLQALNKLYQLYPFLKPQNRAEREKDYKLLAAISKHRHRNPGNYNILGALSNARNKLYCYPNLDRYIDDFRYSDYLMVKQPTEYDKPNFTGPYIAGPFSADLERLYQRYKVKEGEWEDFLEVFNTLEKAPIFDQELVAYIVNKKNAKYGNNSNLTPEERYAWEERLKKAVERYIERLMIRRLKSLSESDRAAYMRHHSKKPPRMRPRWMKRFEPVYDLSRFNPEQLEVIQEVEDREDQVENIEKDFYKRVTPYDMRMLTDIERKKEIDEIKREFYDRATPHDLEMIKSIISRQY